MATRDFDVRRALHAKILDDHHADPDTLVLDELGVWYGTVRIDVAVVNGRLEGFEIKSDRDTLERLPVQEKTYSRIFDRVTLVVGERHIQAARDLIPAWWGTKVATQGARGAVHFREDRRPTFNPCLDPIGVAALLWSEELKEELTSRDAVRGYRSKPRDVLSRRLAEMLPLEELRGVVRKRLKARQGWRAAPPQT